jgi:hypothetical protein
MLILECSQGCYAVKIWPLDLWPWKSGVPDSLKDYVCTKFGQNPLKDVDSRVFTESTSFNGFWQNLVHTYILRESGTILIFKVKGQGHRV